jgi:tetratricopeptide (TPR) repeat protein
MARLGKTQEAIAAYDKATRIAPNFELAQVNKGNTLMAAEKYEEARRCFDKALELNPKNAHAWFSRGTILRKLKAPTEEALKALDAALAIDPKHTGAWNTKGDLLLDQKKVDEALECYETVIKLQPENVDAWFHRGTALSQKTKYSEAIASLDKATELDPEFLDAWNARDISRMLEHLTDDVEWYDPAMPDPPFEVVPYLIGRLIQLLSSPQSQASVDTIRAKYHSAYFENYFHELQARTMVVERRYVDRDYLEDYAAY